MGEHQLLLGTAITAALTAGQEILAVYADTFSVTHKEDRSPLTAADERAHRSIVDVLRTTGLPVLSEEGLMPDLAERQSWQRYWLVDPLDGTKEFVKRNGEFSVNIALMERDALPAGPLGSATPVAGALYVPVKDVLYFAWQGGGAYRQTHAATSGKLSTYERAALSMRMPTTSPSMFTIATSRSHRSVETDAFVARMEKEHGSVQFITMGSALKICLVAEGIADVYPRYAPTMEWDTAAGHAICREAGKEIMDVATEAPMRYNKHELVNNWFIVQ